MGTKVIFFISLLLIIFMTACDPGPSCKPGTIVDTKTGKCVEDNCINHECDSGEYCIMDAQIGPMCLCNEPEYLPAPLDPFNNGAEPERGKQLFCQENPCLDQYWINKCANFGGCFLVKDMDNGSNHGTNLYRGKCRNAN